MKNIDFNKPAEELAKELLGKVLSYNGKSYMITVTEAYPASDYYSYVNVYGSTSVGHNCLVKPKMKTYGYKDDYDNKPGKCFVVSDMIHIVGQLSKDEQGNDAFDHVLIRGGIEIKSEKLVADEYPELNFVKGLPCVLCADRLKIKTQAYDLTDEHSVLKLKDGFSVGKYYLTGKRVNLKQNKNKDESGKIMNSFLRYYCIPDRKWFEYKETD